MHKPQRDADLFAVCFRSLFGHFYALESKLQGSGFPSEAFLRRCFQPEEVSQGLLSGDLHSSWGLETCLPGGAGNLPSWWGLETCLPGGGAGDLCSWWGLLWVCHFGRVSLRLSFFSGLLLRSRETGDVQWFDAVASALRTPHPTW